MSFSILRIPATGVFAAQKQMEVAGNNVANANNANYSRRYVDLGQLVAGQDGGSGVSVLAVTRVRNLLADNTWRSEAGTLGEVTARAEVLAGAETSLGTLDQGLTTLTDDFFRSWQQLSMAPNDTAARDGVLASGALVAGAYNRLSAALDTQIVNARQTSMDVMIEVNSLLSDVADLNSAILQAQTGEASTADLMDERDKKFDQLASLVGATVRYTNGSDPEVLIGGYTAVIGDYAAQFTVSGLGTPTSPMALQVSGGSATVTPAGGKVGGLFDAINVDIPDLRTRLDDSALALRDQVNNQQVLGFDRFGNPGIPMFTGTAASDLTVDPAFTPDQLAAATTATGAPGDGNNALTIAKFQQDTASSSAVSMVRGYTLYVGSRVDAMRRDQAIADSVLTATQDVRISDMGVNVDEEMVDLVRFQRAYQAAARAISIADEVLDTLINRMMR